MSQYDKLRGMLNLLTDKQFPDTIRGFASHMEHENMLVELPRPIEIIDRGTFLGDIQQRRFLKEFEEYLLKHSMFAKQLQSRIEELADPQASVIPFTNRKNEIKLITYSVPNTKYFLVHAPAGYGKSMLLEELEQYFTESKWHHALVKIERDRHISDLAKALGERLGITLSADVNISWGYRVSGAWKAKYRDLLPKGLALLIDLEKEPSSDFLRQLLDEFIPHVEENLSSLEAYKKDDFQFRVIVSGRYLATMSEVKQSQLYQSLTSVPLSPFNYDVIVDTVKKYLTGEVLENMKEIAAHVLYLSAGHPGCIASILQKFQETGIPIEAFLRNYRKTIWQDIVKKYTDEVVNELPKLVPNLEEAFIFLSTFRYIGNRALGRAINDYKPEGIRDAFDLRDALTSTFLFSQKGRFLKDDITRRLLVVHSQKKSLQQFKKHCEVAQQLCVELITNPREHPEHWVIEYLFQRLQQCMETDDTEHPEKRLEFRQDILAKDVPHVIDLLTRRDVSPDRRHVEIDSLISELDQEEQWEFRFTINYLLREEQYNDEPFLALKKAFQLHNTPETWQGRSKHAE